MENYNKLVNYVNSTCWTDDTDTKTIVAAAEKIYEKMSLGKTKKKELYRLCGQTGSGKTTQLLGSLSMVMEDLKADPVILAVRFCAEAHPKYEYFKANFPTGELREKTNGFALKCMSYVLKLLIENGYMVVLDITLLDPVFENFILNLLTKNDYFVEYHILAVNKEISDAFLLKRQKETNRVVYKSSSDYFYEVLIKGLEFLTKNDDKNNCFVWNAFDLEPVYHGKISECFEIFKQNQALIKEFSHTEKELLESKYKFITKK